MTDVFGDDEPEDDWHPDDPLGLLVDNLRRRVLLLLDVVDTHNSFTERDRVRLAELVDDLAHLGRRVHVMAGRT